MSKYKNILLHDMYEVYIKHTDKNIHELMCDVKLNKNVII